MKQNITKIFRSLPFFLFICCFLTNTNAQNIAIEQDAACINCPDLTADPSAALEVRATDKGILVPRVANTSAISDPAEGLVVYDNSDNDFKYYDGSEWYSMGLKHISFPTFANTFVGINAGISNVNTVTGGRENTFIGANAGPANTTGQENTAVGSKALQFNTTGTGNTAVGRNALGVNTTGGTNTAVGWSALGSNSTGIHNTATGWGALIANTTGNNNTAYGTFAMYRRKTGNDNTAFGLNALYSDTIGSYNTAIGRQAFSLGTYDNSTAVGYNTQITGSNQVRLGNSSVTSIGGYTNWTNVSDARFKKQVQNDVPGLAFISLLSPVTYQMDMDAIAKHQNTPDDMRLKDSEQAKAAIRYTGFLAQDVEKAAEAVGYDFSGVDAPQHERDNYSLRYAEFVVPLVKAVQELSEKNEKLEMVNTEKDQKIVDLETRLSKIEARLKNEMVSRDEN